jgi:hypothetical protein
MAAEASSRVYRAGRLVCLGLVVGVSLLDLQSNHHARSVSAGRWLRKGRRDVAQPGRPLSTAKRHVSRNLRGLGLRDRAQVVVVAYEAGL